ncbi:MAG: IucA/IucC family C-terminal-domain containing protein [bacterium]
MSNKSILTPNTPSHNEEWITSFDDPLSLLIYTERYVNKGAYHSYRHRSEVSRQFRPLDGDDEFDLPYVSLPKKAVNLYQTQDVPELNNIILDNKQVHFFIHPDMVDVYTERGIGEFAKERISGYVKACPTSSTRTLITSLDGKPYMIKVDLSGKKLGRLPRALTEVSAIQSHYMSGEFIKISKTDNLPATFGYLPEPMSLGTSCLDSSFGNIFRLVNPSPTNQSGKYLMPVFSLYSPDFRNPGHTLIIKQLVNFSGLSPEKFFEEKVARPMISNVLFIAFKYGILLEAHTQNTLIELDSDWQITRFIYRDLQAASVNPEYRKKIGLPADNPKESKIAGGRVPQNTIPIEYSTFYDHRIGYHSLEEIIIALASLYPTQVNVLQRIVKRIFKEVMEELGVNPDSYFPPSSYYIFSDGDSTTGHLTVEEYPDPPYR